MFEESPEEWCPPGGPSIVHSTVHKSWVEARGAPRRRAEDCAPEPGGSAALVRMATRFISSGNPVATFSDQQGVDGKVTGQGGSAGARRSVVNRVLHS